MLRFPSVWVGSYRLLSATAGAAAAWADNFTDDYRGLLISANWTRTLYSSSYASCAVTFFTFWEIVRCHVIGHQ
ncbi:MAG: hypothetical protein JWN70_435 [Planctomycetaceae bacterium]|nr:hypothetical protein [Planctomycetaceae bacterium]